MTFALWLAEFLNNALTERGWTTRHLQNVSSVPDSTISNYLRGKSDNPSADNLRLIAVALGLDEDFFQVKRREFSDAAAKENLLVAKARDKQLLEEMTALNREAMIEMLNDYKAYSDEKVNAIYDRTSKQNRAVVEQCRVHEAEFRAQCEELMQKEREAFAAAKEQDERSKAYLRALVRNLSILCAILAIYAFYAFAEFDIYDHTKGIARAQSATFVPHMLVIILLSYLILSTIKNAFLDWRNKKR